MSSNAFNHMMNDWLDRNEQHFGLTNAGVLASNPLKLFKLPGKDNPSDLLTKHKSGPEACRFLKMLGVVSLSGRAALAPTRTTTVHR